MADYKVAGRRRTSRCRCGNLLIFDGRALSVAEAAGAGDAQPLEPTLTPSEARVEGLAAPAPTLPAPAPTLPAPAPTLLAPASGATAAADPQPASDARSIGRIHLRKAGPRSADSDDVRPLPPSPRVDPAPVAPAPSEVPTWSGEQHERFEGFDAHDLDRLAEAIRPAWEAPASERITPPGDDPEVVVHYPREWQPPPSKRRRTRVSWDVTPTLPLSLTPEPPKTVAQEGDEREAASAPVPANAEPMPDEPPRSGPSASEPETDAVAPQQTEPAPELDARVGKSGGPGLESTAPTALSQPAAAGGRSSAAMLWGAGLAAAALLALVWRGNATNAPAVNPSAVNPSAVNPSAVNPSAANPGAVTPTAAGEAAARRAESAPPIPPRASASEASDTTEPVDTTAPAAVPPASAAAEAPTPASTPPTSAAPPLAPAPVPPPTPTHAPNATTPLTVPHSAPATSESATPTAPPEPASASTEPAPPEPKPAGPDPGEVARALASAASRARSCSASDVPTGNGSIRILLNPSGGVLNATTLGEFQGTAAGSCVENAFRTAPTPPYQGRTLSTVYPFSLIVD